MLRAALTALILTTTALTAPTPSLAQSDGDDARIEQVEALSARGGEKFAAGRYKEAIALFEQANALTTVATLLYNIGLCYDRMNDKDNARIYYEEFILAPDADASLRGKALSRIKEIDREKRNASVNPIEGSGGGGRVGDAERGREESGPWLTVGIVSTVAGVALIGTGAAFGVLSQSDQDTFNNSRELSTKQTSKEDATSKAAAADILFSLGGATLVAGIVFLAIDYGSQSEAPPASGRWTPMVGPGTLGAVFEMPFDGP